MQTAETWINSADGRISDQSGTDRAEVEAGLATAATGLAIATELRALNAKLERLVERLLPSDG